MSQQMFEPEEQQQQSQQQKRRASEPSRRNHKTREMPKNEHPATFEEPFATTFPYSASESIDSTSENQDDEKVAYQAGYSGYTDSNNGSFSPDGDAMKSGYRPYNAYRPSNTPASSYVPPWARPQQHKNSVMRVLGTVLAILVAVMLLIKVIIPLLIVLFAFAAIIIVLISVALLVFGLFIVGFLRLLGIRIPLRPSRIWNRRRRHWRHLYFDA